MSAIPDSTLRPVSADAPRSRASATRPPTFVREFGSGIELVATAIRRSVARPITWGPEFVAQYLEQAQMWDVIPAAGSCPLLAEHEEGKR